MSDLSNCQLGQLDEFEDRVAWYGREWWEDDEKDKSRPSESQGKGSEERRAYVTQ